MTSAEALADSIIIKKKSKVGVQWCHGSDIFRDKEAVKLFSGCVLLAFNVANGDK